MRLALNWQLTSLACEMSHNNQFDDNNVIIVVIIKAEKIHIKRHRLQSHATLSPPRQKADIFTCSVLRMLHSV